MKNDATLRKIQVPYRKAKKRVSDALRPAICATIRRLADSMPEAENGKKRFQPNMDEKRVSVPGAFKLDHF